LGSTWGPLPPLLIQSAMSLGSMKSRTGRYTALAAEHALGAAFGRGHRLGEHRLGIL
jgi:hypothetical protein